MKEFNGLYVSKKIIRKSFEKIIFTRHELIYNFIDFKAKSRQKILQNAEKCAAPAEASHVSFGRLKYSMKFKEFAII